jgi:CHAT domain-containing protein
MALLNNPDAMNRTANLERFWKLGNGLYQQLMASFRLPTGRVILSPDGVFVPFETLSRSANQSKYLVEDYAFSYAYSGRLLLKNKGSRSMMDALRGVNFLGVAPVKFTSTLGQVSLPGSDAALQSISAYFRSPTLLTYEAATRRAFLKQAATARVVHLFTHAVADSTQREPVLYFADSTLRLSDLGEEGLPNTQMVVLAACKTGVGANQQGEGVFSLARGFAALGAPSILTTLWSVENDATYKLTNLFYQHIDEGLPKDLALQQAKQDWLKSSEGAGQLPNYWAGLIVVGDSNPLTPASQWPWVAVGVLLAGGVGVWQWLRRRSRPQTSAYQKPTAY